MIDRAIEGRRIAKQLGIFAIEVAHFLHDVDTLRRIQNFEENPRTAKPQVHQRKIDIVISAGRGFEGVSGSLLPLEPARICASSVRDRPFWP